MIINWLTLPDESGLLFIGIGLIFFITTVCEWRKGYRSVEGHFETPLNWKASVIMRIIFSSLLISMPFVTADESETINRTLFFQICLGIMVAITMVSMIYSFVWWLKNRRRLGFL